ncbi:glycosyltransferase family 4 protein [Gordonia sp. ABSL1-1]|uniref:glycosyltransferase family 4 protein n=1 Tax=Gordonia sp. ABSL1-1 TaxID=3053923 RepID=UPI002572959A|nr:glycosyltransferase family 4 protein [Gordonia sp. ABSL1-1]MDL9936073.1 glycosyltransferase family 4 protein [Gordonia sp. ABSL1-1]
MARDIVRALVLDQGPGLWGAQKYLLRLRPGLAERGVELTLGCPPQLEQYRHWLDQGLPTIPLALPIDRSIRVDGRITVRHTATEVRNSLRAGHLIARVVREHGFDVVLANSHWTHLDAGLAARRWRIPTVLNLHETPMPGVGSRLREVAVAAAHHTIAVSTSVADTVRTGLRSRVTVIPNGVDTDEFAPAADTATRAALRTRLGLPAGRPIILAATRIDPTKRIEDLLDLARVVGDRATVVVAGTTSAFPDYHREILAAAAELPTGAITFLGARDDVPSLLAGADVFVHTGVVEGMPLGLVEAQSAGVPVVAYAAAGVREAVLDGTSGRVVGCGDTGALIAACADLLADADRRRDYAAAARAHTLAHHRIDDQAAANATLLHRISRGPR